MKIIQKLFGNEKRGFQKREDNKSSTEITACPHCNKTLIKIPTRKKKCEFCGKYIFVRTRPDTRKQILVTEKEAQRIDAEWGHAIRVSYWTRQVSEYGISQSQIDSEQKRLSKKFNKVASMNDTFWAIFNNLVVSHLDEYKELSGIYYNMALFLDEEGKDSYQIRCQAAKYDLLSCKQQGARKVRILSAKGSSCPSCEKLNGKIFTVEEALKKMPIPVKNCSRHMNNEKYGFCRCCWLHVVEGF